MTVNNAMTEIIRLHQITAGFFKGDTISFGTGDAFTKGKLYVYGNTGWTLGDKDEAAHGPLLIAGATADTTGTNFPDKGMCIKGLFRIDTISGTETLGSVVYLLPPLCITDNQLEKCYAAIANALENL